MMVGQATAFAPNYGKAMIAAARVFNLLDRCCNQAHLLSLHCPHLHLHHHHHHHLEMQQEAQD